MYERIRKLRRELDLTQQEFADKLNIKRNTVATYETGKSNPSDAAVNLICREFNVSENWLRTGNGEMFVPAPSNTLDALAEEYGLNLFERTVIEKLVNLNEKQWAALFDLVNTIFSNAPHATPLPLKPEPLPSQQEEPHSMTVAEAEAEYIKAMSERAQRREHTVLNTTAADTKKIG